MTPKSVLTNLGALIALVLAPALVGCASGPRLMEAPTSGQVSLVTGYLDMTDAPAELQWLSMKRLKPPTDKPYFDCAVSQGVFYNTHAAPGLYRLEDFGGWGKGFLGSNTRYTFGFPAQGKNEWDPVIEKPGIYFVGSYKYKAIKTGPFEPGRYTLIRTESPTEKEVLSKLLPLAGETVWKKRITNRLEELSK